MTTFKNLNISDFLGISASGLCAIHCALTPVLFITKPLIEQSTGAHSHGNWFWASLDYVFLILSFIAVWFTSKHTSYQKIKWVLWSAWLVFTIGIISEFFEFHHGIWLMYIGSIALIIAHIKNYRYCKKCRIKNDA